MSSSLFLRNLFFTILQPGLVAGLFPYMILGDAFKVGFISPFGILQFVGTVIFILGVALMLYCIYYFASEGHGTLSPADPTKNLVIHGPYRYSRNPMYIGVTLALIGEVLFFKSLNLLYYTVFIFLMFTLFVIIVEEPRLRRDFGEQYADYRRKVRRWL